MGVVPYPKHYKVIGNKWVFRTKLKANKALDKYKSHLVPKGFQLIAHIDYLETFSSMIKPTTISIVLTISLSKGWSV